MVISPCESCTYRKAKQKNVTKSNVSEKAKVDHGQIYLDILTSISKMGESQFNETTGMLQMTGLDKRTEIFTIQKYGGALIYLI